MNIPKTKTNTKFGLTVNGTDIYFSTKELTVNTGKKALRTGAVVKMFEEYFLFDYTDGINPVTIGHQKFDRTVLLKY